MINGYSIIISAYKTAKYVEECLDSITLQSYFINNDNYEILLGIDFCEETLNVVKKIQGKYKNLRVFYMLKNMGTYVTSNTLLSKSKYDKIIRFDSDDIMLIDMLHDVNSKFKYSDIVNLGFYDLIDNSITVTIGGFNAHGAICYRKNIINELGGYKNWLCGADTDLIYRFKEHYRVFDNEYYHFYRRIRKDSLSHNNKTGMGSEIREQYRKLLKKGFEYVEPVTNDFIEIYPEEYIGEIKYNFITRHVVHSKNQKTNSRPPTRAKLKQQQLESEKEIKSEIETGPKISKKAIPVNPSKLYIPTEKPSSTQKIHDELAAGRLRKGRGYNPRNKKW
jgi:glycosyltransferase involved in cell wall biosynthesis